MLDAKQQQKSVTEVRILEAAVQLFARQGFNATGTREIAQLAGVNETTLFRYYGTKKDLFWAALEARLSRIRVGRELQNALAEENDPAVVIPMVFAFLVQTISDQPELIRILYVSALELPGADKLYQKHLGAIFDSVQSYLLKAASRGAISKVDPNIATLSFAGTVIAHSSLYQLFVGRQLPFSSTEEACSAYSEFWLTILKADTVTQSLCTIT
jgi:AcrR family transcriptional regulator